MAAALLAALFYGADWQHAARHFEGLSLETTMTVSLATILGVSYLLETRQDTNNGGGHRVLVLGKLRSLASRDRSEVVAAHERPPSRSRRIAEVPLEAGRGQGTWDHLAILEFTNDAIIIWEMDGRGILFWNRAAEDLYGYKREQALGRITHDLLATQFTGGVRQLEWITRYGVWAGELRHRHRDGRQIKVESRLALMSQENERWLGARSEPRLAR